MTDAAFDFADIDARALAVAPEICGQLLNRCGWPTGDCREWNRRARPRRYRFEIDGNTGAWLEGQPPRAPTKKNPLPEPDERVQGQGFVELVAHVTKTQTDRAAEKFSPMWSTV
jgi:hypothetical protein